MEIESVALIQSFAGAYGAARPKISAFSGEMETAVMAHYGLFH
jgi:hypothetical protein